MDFLNHMFEDFYKESAIMYEGLIFTHPLFKSFNIIKREGYKIKVSKDSNTFNVKFLGDKKLWNDLLKLTNNLGWFPSYIWYGNKKYKYLKRLVDNLLIKNIFFVIRFEAKYDIEIDEIPKKLYHITPKVYLDKILKIGLTPKSKQKLSYHPDRIYLSESIKEIIKLSKKLKIMSGHKEYILLEIDQDLSEHLKLFKDPNFNYGFYTLNNISPASIKVIGKL